MDTSNRYLQQKLLSNQTLQIITTTIDPRILDMVATYGETPRALTAPMMKGIITDAVRISVRVLQTPGHVSSTGKDGTTPRDYKLAVRYSQDNLPVLIGVIVFPPTMGHSGIQDIINKRKSTSPSVSRNTQKFYTSIDGNLADDGDYVAIFRKVLGCKHSNSLSSNIYLRCRMDFMK